jgi:hypothetical protein
MNAARLVSLCGLVSLAGCLTYVVAPPADPVKALRAPVYLEDMARVEHNGGDAVRFVLRIRAPKDTSIVLFLRDQVPGLQGRDSVRPAIMLRADYEDTATAFTRQIQLTIAGDTVQGGADGLAVPAGSSRRASLLVTTVEAIPQRFAIDLTWYMQLSDSSPRIERREDQSRVARMNKVAVAPVVGAALFSVVLFFLITTPK